MSIKNKFWIDGVLQESDFSPLTDEDRAVTICLGNIDPDKSYGDVKTDCEYELRRAYQAGVADAQPKPVTDEQIDELIHIEFSGLYQFDETELKSMRSVVRNWLATLNQPPAPSFD